MSINKVEHGQIFLINVEHYYTVLLVALYTMSTLLLNTGASFQREL